MFLKTKWDSTGSTTETHATSGLYVTGTLKGSTVNDGNSTGTTTPVAYCGTANVSNSVEKGYVVDDDGAAANAKLAGMPTDTAKLTLVLHTDGHGNQKEYYTVEGTSIKITSNTDLLTYAKDGALTISVKGGGAVDLDTLFGNGNHDLGANGTTLVFNGGIVHDSQLTVHGVLFVNGNMAQSAQMNVEGIVVVNGDYTASGNSGNIKVVPGVETITHNHEYTETVPFVVNVNTLLGADNVDSGYKIDLNSIKAEGCTVLIVDDGIGGHNAVIIPQEGTKGTEISFIYHHDNTDGAAPDYVQPTDTTYMGEDYSVVMGKDGNDILSGGANNEIIFGGTGNDTINGGAGNDVLIGGDGNDVLIGGAGSDTLHGGDGNDILIGGDATGVNYSTIYKMGFNADGSFASNMDVDGLKALATSDTGGNTLDGGAGNDILIGGSGTDHLFGGAGNDILIGGAGNDFLKGGNGDNILIGGEGNDTFYWDVKELLTGETGGTDKVLDFGEGDTLHINLAEGYTIAAVENANQIQIVKGDDVLQTIEVQGMEAGDVAAMVEAAQQQSADVATEIILTTQAG